MKKKVILSTMLFILGVVALLALGGCGSGKNQEDWLHGGQAIPIEIAYKGYNYKITGETVGAIKIVPDNLQFIGHGIEMESPPPSPTGECNPQPVYEVYSIKGIDENEAVAVKFELVGQSGAYYVFFKYQRQ
jgi:hypothetical protein